MKIFNDETSTTYHTETIWNSVSTNNPFENKLLHIDMSRPMNMLRTRRKDCNVKPNRRDNRATRLDRKSSRGMIYENEELRLKTININAEVESRQSDIKKLKKENELLKKGLWYLRDEYDKLEKLIKDKKLEFESSSNNGSTSSDSESYSSYSEDGEEETTQNMQNVQRTNLKNLQDQFDHLSVVTEETSAENSDLHSNREVSLSKETWNNCEDILKPDQSYPEFRCLAKSPSLPMSDNVPVNFFSPIRTSKSFDGNLEQFNEFIYPEDFYNDQFNHSNPTVITNNERNSENFVSKKIVKTNATNFFQNMVLVPKTASSPDIEVQGMEKSVTDLIVKIDNQQFNNTPIVFSNTPSQSTFSNGGNLEELLHDIESISQKAGHLNTQYGFPEDYEYPHNDNSQTYNEKEEESADKAFKSELNVVLVPNPMPLIGFDKYKNMQRSMENLTTKKTEDINVPQSATLAEPSIPLETSKLISLTKSALPSVAPNPDVNIFQNREVEPNPFFFGNFKDNYVNADHFSMRYNPENLFKNQNLDTAQDSDTSKTYNAEGFKNENTQSIESDRSLPKCGSKTNLLELTSSDHVSSENDDKQKTIMEKCNGKPAIKSEKPQAKPKSPKLSIRKKVSIHFKGKKEKNKLCYNSDSSIPKTPSERRISIFERRLSDKDKSKLVHPKALRLETQRSVPETNSELKTPSSSESKNGSDKKFDKKETGSDKKSRKSVSVSPDRKHVQLKEDGQQKKHKKLKKGDKSRPRRQSNVTEVRALRERSFSVCTDRSNILEHPLGLGFGSNLYVDEDSERERTNSLSSCDTTEAEQRRKMSTLPNVALSGKVPWCGCWGNGCL